MVLKSHNPQNDNVFTAQPLSPSVSFGYLSVCSRVLLVHVNQALSENTLPSHLKVARVIPILKKNQTPLTKDSYHPYLLY